MGDHSLQHLHPETGLWGACLCCTQPSLMQHPWVLFPSSTSNPQNKPKRHLGAQLLADPSPHQAAPMGALLPVTFIPRWDCRVISVTATQSSIHGCSSPAAPPFSDKNVEYPSLQTQTSPKQHPQMPIPGHLQPQSQKPLRRFSSLLTQHWSGHWLATSPIPLLPLHYFPLPRSPVWCHGSWWLPAAGPAAAGRHCAGPALVPRMVPRGQEGPQRPTGRDPASFPTSSPNPNPVLTYCPLSALTTSLQ